MPASPKTQKTIWGIFAARCAICKEHLVEREEGVDSLVGEVAHLVGEKKGAARGISTLSLKERNSPDNLMLLCLKHHKMVDDNEENFSLEKLRGIRQEFLDWLSDSLGSTKRWKVKISQYAYLNVPRLDEFAAIEGFDIRRDGIDKNATLRSLGFELNNLMLAYRRSLEAMQIDAVAANTVDFAHEGYVGRLLSFDRLRFRTKNLPLYRPKKADDFTFTGDLKKDPHIYHQFESWRLVININPRWITTDTAYGLFRASGGASTLSGFVRLSQVDYESRTMVATGLALGLPPSILDQHESEDEDELQALTDTDLAKHENEKVAARGVYFTPSPEVCDLCNRLFAKENYMIDGAIKGSTCWGCLCKNCFAVNGKELGTGYGQLYRKNAEGWLMVAGAPENDPEEN